MDIYIARYNNALRIAEKINNLLDKGFIIFDDTGRKVTKFIVNDYGDILEETSPHMHLIYFDNTTQSSDYFTTIKEYNNYFKDWVYINPKDIHKLIDDK